MWTNTCCSHPLGIPGETGAELDAAVLGVKRAAQRKLNHELGIKPEQVPLEKFEFFSRIYYKAPSDGKWGEHESMSSVALLNPHPSNLTSRLYPLHPSRRGSGYQRERSTRLAVRVCRRVEADVRAARSEIHAVVQADLQLHALRVVGPSRVGDLGQVQERARDSPDVRRCRREKLHVIRLFS